MHNYWSRKKRLNHTNRLAYPSDNVLSPRDRVSIYLVASVIFTRFFYQCDCESFIHAALATCLFFLWALYCYDTYSRFEMRACEFARSIDAAEFVLASHLFES